VPSAENRLAVTARCLVEDIGLSRDADWEEESVRIAVLRAFRERRGQDPEGPERILSVRRYVSAPIFSLHSGDDRAATWYDDVEDVVWLLGVGREHNYEHLEGLARRGTLLPTYVDYDALDAEIPDRFELERIGRQARDLREQARARPGLIIEGQLGGRVQVRVCVEHGDPVLLTVAVSQRIRGVGEFPPTWQLIVAQAFFPGASFPTDFTPFAVAIDGSDVRADELALVNFLGDAV